ncbi:MAG: GNAT family N-acetyltransferase [Sphingomonadaceae bacterium]
MEHSQLNAGQAPALRAFHTGLQYPHSKAVPETGFAEAWLHLEHYARLPTQSRHFTYAMAQTMLERSTVEVFAAPGYEAIGAILPLCRSPEYFSRWRMIGADEIYEPGDALYDCPDAARMLAPLLISDGRAFQFDRVPEGSHFISALQAASKKKGHLRITPARSCPTIALDESWAEPHEKFNAGRRSDFRRAGRKAKETGEVSLDVLIPQPYQFDTLFDEACTLEMRSWKREAGTAIACDPQKEAFFRAYFRACCEKQTFCIAFMRVDGKPVATQLAVIEADSYWLFKIAYDNAYRKCSPGTLLMLATLGWAAKRGLRAYELLGEDESWISDFWTRDTHPCVQLRYYPYSLRGLMNFGQDGAGWLKSRLHRSRDGNASGTTE